MDNEQFMETCLECNKKFSKEIELHHHLKVHKLPIAAYFQKHFPRYDKHDGSMIKFKNKEFYFNADFNTKGSFKLWLNSVSKGEKTAYFTEVFKKRKERKSLVFAPSQIELRSLKLPGIRYLTGLFGDYHEFCSSLGFKNRYDYKKDSLSASKDLSKSKIIIDTREQIPLSFNLRTKKESLSFGDYRLTNDSVTCDCYFERKSLSDFYSTLSVGRERFRKEVERAKKAGAYLIVIVESPFESVEGYTKLRAVYGKVKISPEYVYYNMRSIIQDFENIQFLFVKDRDESSRVIEKIFASDCEYKDCDLQLLYDLERL